jgi:hypothetical protein
MREYNGNVYMTDDNGKVYKRTSVGGYSSLGTLTDSNGNGLGVYEDTIYVATNNGISSIDTADDSVSSDIFKSETSEASTMNDEWVAASTYTTPTSISETSANKYTWTAAAASIIGISLRVVAKGTGNWTVTLHNNSNVVIATLTVASADIATNNVNRFLLIRIFCLCLF